MLSVSNSLYELPSYDASIGKWLLQSRKSVDECLVARTFNYTIINGDSKYTFIYDGKSVKPTPRTLRVYGADYLQPKVSKLASRIVQRQASSSSVGKTDEEVCTESGDSLEDILVKAGVSHLQPKSFNNVNGND